MRKAVPAEKGSQPAGPYSRAVVANGFVFFTGPCPANPETSTMPEAFADQIRQTLSNVQTILETAGTNLDNVVKVNAYVTELMRFGKVNEVYKEFFQYDPPARTSVTSGLLGFLVEIDCIPVLQRALFSGAVLVVAALLLLVGIIDPVAPSYTAMAYAFLVLFVLPLATIGVYRTASSRGEQRRVK